MARNLRGRYTVSRMLGQGWEIIDCVPSAGKGHGRWRAKFMRDTAKRERSKGQRAKVKAFRWGNEKHLCVLVKKR